MHKLTRSFPVFERREIGYQMRRAAVSVPANIAEGYGRKASAAEFRHFIRNALGSCNETKVMINIAHDLGYTDAEKHRELSSRYEKLS
ncbi:MAG: four helix bundle protein, partial [Bacillota bacterium]